MGDQLLSSAYIIILFIIILFGAYYVSRYVGNFQSRKTNNSNIKIIGVISVGPQKTLQLVKIGQEIILIGVSKDKISYIKDISSDSLDDMSELNIKTASFNKYFDKLINKRKNTSQSIEDGEGKDEQYH